MNREKELTVSRQVALDAGALLKGFLGRVTDFEGNPFTPFLKTLLASNSLVHEDMLKALRL
jgi:hypothetical protein